MTPKRDLNKFLTNIPVQVNLKAMKNKPYYAIKYVSLQTGLTPHVIRAWEKRYDAVVPVRSPKNRRLYSEEDVQRLQMLKSATDAGHNISQVAGLTTKDLALLVQREGTAASPVTRSTISAQVGSAEDLFDKLTEESVKQKGEFVVIVEN